MAHNPKVRGSNPLPATKEIKGLQMMQAFFVFLFFEVIPFLPVRFYMYKRQDEVDAISLFRGYDRVLNRSLNSHLCPCVLKSLLNSLP
jgi:hypothetical protein